MSVKLPKIPPIEPQQNRTDNYQDVAIPQAVRTSTSYKLSGINAKVCGHFVEYCKHHAF